MSVLVSTVLSRSTLRGRKGPGPVCKLDTGAELTCCDNGHRVSREGTTRVIPGLSRRSFSGFIDSCSVSTLRRVHSGLNRCKFSMRPCRINGTYTGVLTRVVGHQSRKLSSSIAGLSCGQLRGNRELGGVTPTSVRHENSGLRVTKRAVAVGRTLIPSDVTRRRLRCVRTLCRIFTRGLGQRGFAGSSVPLLGENVHRGFHRRQRTCCDTIDIRHSIQSVFASKRSRFRVLGSST